VNVKLFSSKFKVSYYDGNFQVYLCSAHMLVLLNDLVYEYGMGSPSYFL